MSLNAPGEKRCLDAVVCFRGLLPGLLGRFEGEPVLVEEYMKLLRRIAVDVIGELAALAVDRLYSQLPGNLHLCMTIGRKGIGQRDQADVVLLRNVLDVMLDNNAAADHFDIDGHAPIPIAPRTRIAPTSTTMDRFRRNRASVLNFVEQRWIADSSSRAVCGRFAGSTANIDCNSAITRAGT